MVVIPIGLIRTISIHALREESDLFQLGIKQDK